MVSADCHMTLKMENKVARGNEHVAETNVQTACPVPRDSTYRDAQPAKSQDPDTSRTFS